MWVQIIVSLVMMVISSALQASAAPKGQKEPEAGKLDVPTAEEGKPIPVIFGTVIIKDSNVTWYGDANTSAIKSQGGGKK